MLFSLPQTLKVITNLDLVVPEKIIIHIVSYLGLRYITFKYTMHHTLLGEKNPEPSLW